MIKVTLNGGEREVKKGLTVFELVRSFDLQPEKIVVQINDNVISTVECEGYQMKGGDRIEFIKFMAGG